MRRLGSQDAAFLYGETAEWHMHVAALLLVDGADSSRFSFDMFCHCIEERLDLAPHFRWKVEEVPFGIDAPIWVEDEAFDLDYHIRRAGVPDPGDIGALYDLVGRLCSYKLDRRRPLWEMWFIDGLKDRRTAVLFKAHHAFTDGVSGAAIAELLLDFEANPPVSTEAPPPVVVERAPLPGELFVQSVVRQSVRMPLRTAQFAGQTVRQAATLARFLRRGTAAPLPMVQAPRTSLNGAISAQRSFASAMVPLARIKAVRHAFDVTVNDVILALCAGALRSYLIEIDDLPIHPLIAAIPVNLRNPEETDHVGSRIGNLFVSLATDVDAPSERLVAIHDSAAEAKELRTAIRASLTTQITEIAAPAALGSLARAFQSLGIGSRIPPSVNVLVSNVPGPQFPLYVAGGRIDALYPMGPLMMGYGLNVTAMSYQGSVEFGFLACRMLVPDPNVIAIGVERELEALEFAAGLTIDVDLTADERAALETP